MKILLVSPNTLTNPYPVYPLGLDYVAGSISEEHEVRLADLNTLSLEKLDALLAAFKPQIIGLSCRNIDNMEASGSRYFINEYQKIVARLRANSTALLVCGGSGFTIMPQQILAALGADYGIVGEGERFGLLVEAFKKGEDPQHIPGVIASAAKKAITNPPPWDGRIVRNFQADAEHNRFYLDSGGMLNLQSKRGCSFHCIYCSYPHIEGRKHRLIEPKKVAEMAYKLQASGARYFFITDSAFNSDIKHSLAVARAFKAAGVTIPWGGFFAPVRLPADYFAIMADAGLKHVEFGTESLATTMLQTYRKPFTVDDVFAAHQQTLAAGLHVAHYFLLGGPGESTATIAESLDNIEKLQRTVMFFFIGIRIYPQTELYDIALAEGKITPTTNILKPIFYIPDAIDRLTIETLVTTRLGKRVNCIVGSGGPDEVTSVSKLHGRGYTGPLWEHLIR